MILYLFCLHETITNHQFWIWDLKQKPRSVSCCGATYGCCQDLPSKFCTFCSPP